MTITDINFMIAKATSIRDTASKKEAKRLSNIIKRLLISQMNKLTKK